MAKWNADKIEDMQNDLNAATDKWLLDAGWQQTSSTPGSLWLWTKEWNGKTILVNRDTAGYMQQVWEADELLQLMSTFVPNEQERGELPPLDNSDEDHRIATKEVNSYISLMSWQDLANCLICATSESRSRNRQLRAANAEIAKLRALLESKGELTVTSEQIEELPPLNVNIQATEEDHIEGHRFAFECDELLPDRKGLVAVIDKIRTEQLIRERQLRTALARIAELESRETSEARELTSACHGSPLSDADIDGETQQYFCRTCKWACDVVGDGGSHEPSCKPSAEQSSRK